MKLVCLSANTSWYLYNFRANTIKALDRAGYAVVCLCPQDEYSNLLQSDLPCSWFDLKLDNDGTNLFRDLALVVGFFKAYRNLKPSAACHFTIKNNLYGTLAAATLRIPSINNISGLGTAFIRKGWVGMLAVALYRLSQPFAFKVFCQNSDDKAFLEKFKMTPAQKTELLPGSGVDLERFHPSLIEDEKQQPRGFRFLFAGRILAQKGLFELMEAYAEINEQYPESELWLVGFAEVKNDSAIPGDVISKWEAMPGVRWFGATNTIERVYAAVDCVVLPSYREGLPRTLLEANAMGLPVIATDVPGCSAVVEDEYNGLLCRVKNVGSLRDQMKKMIAMKQEERRQMGNRGRELVANEYCETVVINAYLNAIESAVSK